MTESNPHSLKRSFNLLRHFFLLLGIYPFHSNSASKRFIRYLLLIYCYLLTFIYTSITIYFIYEIASVIYYVYANRNLDFITLSIGEMLIFNAAVTQKGLYYWKTREILDFFEKWENFENEYERLTGKQLKTLNYHISLVFVLTTTLGIFGMVITYIDYESFENSELKVLILLILLEVAINSTYAVIYLPRLYTEIMWNMVTIALKNCARQLLDDYANEECNSNRIQHYPYLWMKLAALQNSFSAAFSSIYGWQMAFNFLHVLFLGFGWSGAIYRYVTLEKISQQDAIQLLGLYIEIGQSFVYILISSITADSAQKAVVTLAKRKLLQLISSKEISNGQEKRFLKTVTKTETQIKLGGYGRIDSDFFCKVFLAWINYWIILLQFRNLIQDPSKDPESKQGLMGIINSPDINGWVSQ